MHGGNIGFLSATGEELNMTSKRIILTAMLEFDLCR